MPTVSVIINTYNSSRFLLPAVESVLAQSYRDYELIIVDDGSTDNTRQVMAPYLNRLTYIYQENKKYSAAKNTGIRASSGKYIAFMDSDDIWLPEKLERQVSILEQHSEAVLTYCQAVYIDPDGQQVIFRGKEFCNPEGAELIVADMRKDLFLTTVVAPGSTMLVRRWAVERAGLFDEVHVHGEDWELWLRIAPFGLFAYLPEVLSQYRVYGWQKIVSVEARDSWLHDLVKIVDTATSLWTGDPIEGQRLRDQSLKRIYTHAALASFQMGEIEPAKSKLQKLFENYPETETRDGLVQMALDRAKEIADDTNSLPKAEEFIRTFFSHLPKSAARFESAQGKAIGWLYVNSAFEAYQKRDWVSVRRNLRRGIAAWPWLLFNRGVMSISLKTVMALLMSRGKPPEFE
jgi:glycosyltransferase involved in cell wall biosynthesis